MPWPISRLDAAVWALEKALHRGGLTREKRARYAAMLKEAKRQQTAAVRAVWRVGNG